MNDKNIDRFLELRGKVDHTEAGFDDVTGRPQHILIGFENGLILSIESSSEMTIKILGKDEGSQNG